VLDGADSAKFALGVIYAPTA